MSLYVIFFYLSFYQKLVAGQCLVVNVSRKHIFKMRLCARIASQC